MIAPAAARTSCIKDWVATASAPYYIKVSHFLDEGGCTGYDYNLTVTEGAVADWPAQPTDLTATPVSHCQVDLSWIQHSFNEQGFEIQRLGWKAFGANYGMSMWEKIGTVGWGVSDYSDSGLECNKTYRYRVRAYNASGKSFFTNEASATTFAADAYEADNSYSNAKVITTDGALQLHNFDIAGDQDWVKFTASAGQVYTITTSALGSLNDTELKLYDKNGTTQLAYNDDCAGPESCIKSWAAPSSGVYYVKAYGFAGKGGCPGYHYSLKVTRSPNPTVLNGPYGLYFSDISVGSLLLAWPDTAITEHAFKVDRWQVITGTIGQWRQRGIAGPGLSYLAAAGKPGRRHAQ